MAATTSPIRESPVGREPLLPPAGSASFALLLVLALACTDQGRWVRPDAGKFSWPTTVAIDPAHDYAYVVSTNFDSAYTGGYVTPLDLKAIDALIAAGKASAIPGRPVEVDLGDASLHTAGAVEIGSFGGDISILGSGGAGAYGFVAVRDGDAIQHFSLDRATGTPVLSCSKEAGFSACDPDHEIVLEAPPPAGETDEIQGRDPFALAAGQGPVDGHPLVYAGSVLDGTLWALSIDDPEKPVIAGSVKLSMGLHTIVEGPRIAGDRRVVYATNRLSDTLHVVEVRGTVADDTFELVYRNEVTIPQVDSSGDYFRGMALSSDGRRLYAAFRSPDSLAVFDVQEDGTPAYRGLVVLGGSPSMVAVASSGPSGEDRVYVTDFGGDAVYVVDPAAMSVADRVPVGDGPYGIAVVEDAAVGIRRAYVPLFEDNGLAVIDLDPASETFHLEIGRVK